MAKIRRVLVNPQRKRRPKSSSAPARRKTTNPGTLTVLGLVNPERKTMTKKKTQKRANPSKAKARRPKKNPGVTVSKKTTHRRRRNPNNGPISKGLDFAKAGLAALVGLVLTRQLPQMILKEKNAGAMGYGANVLTAIGSAALASRFAGRQIGTSVGIGGALYVANRILQEQVSPVGKVLSLSGLGDPLAADRSQLAGIRPGYFASPEVYDRQGNPMIPEAIDARVKAIGAPPAAKMAGLRFAA